MEKGLDLEPDERQVKVEQIARLPVWEEVPDDVRVTVGDYVRAYWLRGLIGLLAVLFIAAEMPTGDLWVAKLALFPIVLMLFAGFVTLRTVSPWTLAAQRSLRVDGMPGQWIQKAGDFSLGPYVLVQIVDNKIVVHRRGYRLTVDETFRDKVEGLRLQMRLFGPWSTSSSLKISLEDEDIHLTAEDNGELSYRLAELGWVMIVDRKRSLGTRKQSESEKVLEGRDE